MYLLQNIKSKIFKTLEANTLSIEKDNVPLTVNKELKDDLSADNNPENSGFEFINK